MKIPRPDQAEAICSLRALMRTTKRGILQAPTGAGKTVIMSDLVSRAQQKCKRVIITVPALSLIDQTVAALAQQGVFHTGVIQANNRLTDLSMPVQVASVQTLQRRWRDGQMPEADLVLVDEVHRTFDFFAKWMPDEKWLRVPFIGFSATPWTEGLGRLYENNLLVANTISNLIAQKILVPFRTFAPDSPDLTGVRMTRGDFNAADLDEIMRPKRLVANIVETWRGLARGRVTVCFCCSRAHAEQLTKEFTEAGIGAGYMDCETPLPERREVRRKMLRGEITVVCNVDIVGIGVDWPEVSCIIYARPTMADHRFVQNIGRGLRACEGKEDLLILDHSTTTQRLGFVDEIYNYHTGLDETKIKVAAQKAVLLPKECPSCHLLKPPRVAVCPHCGFNAIAHADPVPVQRGTLREMRPGDMGNDWKKALPDKQHCWGQLVWYGRSHGHKPGWAAVAVQKIFGTWPPRGEPDPATVVEPTRPLLLWILEEKESFKKDQRNQRRREERERMMQRMADRQQLRVLATQAVKQPTINGHNGNGNGQGNGHAEPGRESPPNGAVLPVEHIERQFEPPQSSLMSEDDWRDFK
jgi:DNA repair protein RadD